MKEVKKLIEDPSILDATLDWKNSLTDWQSIHTDLPSTLFQCHNARLHHCADDRINLVNRNLDSKYRNTKQKVLGSHSFCRIQTIAADTNGSKISASSIYNRTAISPPIQFLPSSSKWPEISSIHPQQSSAGSSSLINHYCNSKDSLIQNKENIRNIHSSNDYYFQNRNRNYIPRRDKIASSSSSKEMRQIQPHRDFISSSSSIETSSILRTDPKLRNLIKSIESALGPEMISSLSKNNSYSVTDSNKSTKNIKHSSYSHHYSRNDSSLFRDDGHGYRSTRSLDHSKKPQISHTSNQRYAIPKVYEPSVFQELTSFSPNLLNDLDKTTSIFPTQVKSRYVLDSSPTVVDNDINGLDWSGHHHHNNNNDLPNDRLSPRNKFSHSNLSSLSDNRKISPFESSIDLILELTQPKPESNNGQVENFHRPSNFTSSMPRKFILESPTISSTLENFSIDSIEYLKKYNLYNKMISSKNDKDHHRHHMDACIDD